MGIPMLKIRQLRDHLIFNMGILILVRWHLYIETAPCSCTRTLSSDLKYHIFTREGNESCNTQHLNLISYQYNIIEVHYHVLQIGRIQPLPKMLVITLESAITMLLTLNVRGQSYLGLTRSISWLLMPWLLTSPGYQQPWYWLCRIGRCLSYLRKDFNYLRHINVEKWHKMQIYVHVPSEKFST